MKTFCLFVAGVFGLSGVLFAQPRSFQIGFNAVPLLDRTLEVNASLARYPELEFYMHGGYTFSKFYPRNFADNSRYWVGKSGGAYVRLGAKSYLNPRGKFRIYLGAHLTAGYLYQAGKSTTVIYCIMGPCPAMEGEGKNEQYMLSGGITAGVRTNITPRLTVDLGILANRFIFEKPDLNNSHVYIPGYGSGPIQAVASVQYTLKGR